jgi:hypothetical protein
MSGQATETTPTRMASNPLSSNEVDSDTDVLLPW